MQVLTFLTVLYMSVRAELISHQTDQCSKKRRLIGIVADLIFLTINFSVSHFSSMFFNMFKTQIKVTYCYNTENIYVCFFNNLHLSKTPKGPA